MKSNRKFKNEEEAVSAVIGVILMVAITVAIAATVYVYVSGMLSGGPSTAPDISFAQNDVTKKLTVSRVSLNNIPWTDIVVSGNGTAWVGGYVTAGQTINCTAGTVSVSYKGTTLYGSWTFT
jgi:flagellin-like protein